MSKILIADDSRFMRKVLSDILIKNGYENIIEAEDGAKAVELYKSEKPDLVLADIIMPEKDGMQVMKEIVPEGAKVIVISAVGQDEMMSQAKELGSLGYIVKPFEENQVIDAVKSALV